MKMEIQSDAFSSIKTLIKELTEKEVLEENGNQANQEAFYLSSQGITNTNSPWLEKDKEKLFFTEAFQVLYIGDTPYNELKKLFILLSSSNGSNECKKLGLGLMNVSMGGQSIMNVDGGFADYYTIQISINYTPIIMYTEYENEHIIRYVVEDKKLNLKQEGEIDGI